MVLITFILSLLYLFIRLKLKREIAYKNGQHEINFLLIGNVLLILGVIAYYYLSEYKYLTLTLIYLSIIITEIPKIWIYNNSLINRILIVLAGMLIFIPYFNIIVFIGIIIYLLNREYRYGEFPENLGLIVITFSSVIAIITKRYELIWWGATMFYILQHVKHTSQLIEMLKNAGKNAVIDSLTGLYNRRWLYKKLDQLILKQEVGIIFCDIDNFKKLNDEKGHEHGDFVLQKTGEIILRILKGYGFGIRYGGEELVGLVTDYGRTQGLAEKILEAVKKELNITMSIGIAIGHERSEDLMKLADERMYQSKTTGKNKITFENKNIDSQWVDNEINVD